eukprot:10612323-Karenia_brevis.AAC.1
MEGWRPCMPWVEGFTMGVLTDRAALAVVLPTLVITPPVKECRCPTRLWQPPPCLPIGVYIRHGPQR